ncbi:MAG TPA: S49 family peptidase [Accumulibacter sp.]|nr:S49 family peptidase [Accumulibacter sp.]
MLPHLASRLFGTPLLVHRAKLDVILAVLGDRLNIQPPAADMVQPGPRNMPSGTPGIAVIPVHGTLVKRTAGLDAASGLTSYTEIAAMLDSALTDPQVAGILLDIDSPGGEASGSFELARRVREASAVKPVWAVANDAAYSAAYAIGSAANRLIVSETGGVGSIGVIALHIDQSVKDANDGYRYTAVTAGTHKNDFSPHQPLTDEAKAELQAEVDRLYGLFVEHVALMRTLPTDGVRATEAGLYFGANAITAGLADAVGTFESALTDFSLFLSSRSRKSPQARAGTRTEAVIPSKEDSMHDNETQVAEMIGVDQAAVMIAEAKREVAQSAQAIAELCLIAGAPDKAAEFIAAGKTEAEVRRVLIEAKAARSDATPIQSTIHADAGTQEVSRPEASPIVSAVKKLISKE